MAAPRANRLMCFMLLPQNTKSTVALNTFTVSTEMNMLLGRPGTICGPGFVKLMPFVPSASMWSNCSLIAANEVASQRMPTANDRCLPEIIPNGDGGSLADRCGFVFASVAYGVTAPSR